jgi:membrane protein YqaA with SNARE-associated domain
VQTEEHLETEAKRIAESGQVVDPSLYYMKQTIGATSCYVLPVRSELGLNLIVAANACGTIGLMHAVANASTYTGGPVALTSGSFFDRFVTSTMTKTPDERAEDLERNDAVCALVRSTQ